MSDEGASACFQLDCRFRLGLALELSLGCGIWERTGDFEIRLCWVCANIVYRWDKSSFDAVNEFRQQQSETVQPSYRTKPSRERESIAEQAKALLKGEASWKPNDADSETQVWEDDGEAVEVEREVEVPRVGDK